MRNIWFSSRPLGVAAVAKSVIPFLLAIALDTAWIPLDPAAAVTL